jgi:transcription initiation factor TFIIB
MNCLHKNEDTETGERVCIDCGTILGPFIDEGAEWRTFANSETDVSRTGMTINELVPESSYGSMMKLGRGVFGEEAKNIAKQTSWSMSAHGERAWLGIFDIIQTTCTKRGLPKAISHDACSLFKQVPESQKSRGESRRALMAASVFISCRQHDATRSHEELAEIFYTSIKSLCKALAYFESQPSSVLSTQMGLLERLCSSLEVTDKERQDCIAIIEKLPEMDHTPKTIVASILGHITKKMPEVVKQSGVSIASIRKINNKLKKMNIIQ